MADVDMDYLKRKYKNVHDMDTKDYVFREIGSIWAPKIASSFCSASSKYLLVHLTGGGGKNALLQVDKPGRFSNCTTLATLNSCNYSEWCPYNDSMVACVTKKSVCQVFTVPEDAFDSEGKLKARFAPIVTLEPPTKKELTCVRWNPVAQNVIVVVSKEKNGANIWVYDISTGEVLYEIEAGGEVFHCQWSADGSKLIYTLRASSAKMYVTDPRTDEEPKCVDTGLRDAYLFYAATKLYGAKKDYIGVVGKNNKKQEINIVFWDADTLEEERRIKVDGTDAALVPHFDSGRCMLWSYGKTESRLYCHRFFVLDGEIAWKKCPKTALVTTLKKGVTGGCFMPQRGLDYENIEIQRFFGLSTELKSCMVYKMVNPRSRKGYFEPEFYPEAPGLVCPLTADKWKGGENASQVLWSLDPSIKRDATGAAVFVKKATYEQLEKALDKAKSFLTEEQVAAVDEVLSA